jgi:hypothetical protein
MAVYPKRSDELIRRNIPEVPVEKITAIGNVPIPELDLTSLGAPHEHPLVVDMYQSLKESAQNKFFEPSDWQTARLTMLALNQELTAVYKSGELRGSPRPISAVKLQVINQMLASLMTTEGERRRARLEIERNLNPSGEGGKVLTMADHFKERLGAK